MRKSMFALLALAISLFGTQCWAADASCSGEGTMVTCTFSPGFTRGVYEFSSDGRLTVEFDVVLTQFDLKVSVVSVTDPLPLDPREFPTGTGDTPTTVCVRYGFNGNHCDRYDFSGTALTGVPVKNKDYKGLITDILTSYSADPFFTDPTMGGKTPGLSSVVALDEPLTENDTFCFVPAPQENNSSHVQHDFEVAFKLFSGGTCPSGSGTPIRDKTARLSVSTSDPATGLTTGEVVFPPLMNGGEGNKFHWDSKNGLNEYDISLEGLPDGRYTVTVFSSKFSPQSADFCLSSGTVVFPCP